MSDDDAIPQGSYTVRGKERIRLWKQDLTELAKDAGGHHLSWRFRASLDA